MIFDGILNAIFCGISGRLRGGGLLSDSYLLGLRALDGGGGWRFVCNWKFCKIQENPGYGKELISI